MPGPGKKPSHIKLVEGNPGGRPIQEEPEPFTGADVPEPPEYLSEEEAALWRQTAGTLYECGLLTLADENSLALYCSTLRRWHVAHDELKKPPRWVYSMTPAAQGVSRDEYLAKGWTDEQLMAYGYMEEPQLLDPTIMRTRTGYLGPSPYMTMLNKAQDQLNKLHTEFGMTPASRTKVSGAKKPDSGDGMDKFLGDKSGAK